MPSNPFCTVQITNPCISRVLDQMGFVVPNMERRRLRPWDMRCGGRSVRVADLERDERMPIQTELFSLAA